MSSAKKSTHTIYRSFAGTYKEFNGITHNSKGLFKAGYVKLIHIIEVRDNILNGENRTYYI